MTAPRRDPAGTCHLVGCPGKGQHPPHGIGAPTPEAWAASQAGPPAPRLVLIDEGTLRDVSRYLDDSSARTRSRPLLLLAAKVRQLVPGPRPTCCRNAVDIDPVPCPDHS